MTVPSRPNADANCCSDG
ncbi:hypothetical protein ITJ48_15180 [Frigoribacterium sp. VKM Ac-2530]|nr:hypothetical protein [Frigoribacterium sp. VKM Ac-2530]